MANATLLLIQAACLDLLLKGLHECADFVASEFAKVIRKKTEKSLTAFLDDEFSVFDEECLTSEGPCVTMASTASGLEQTVRIDGLRHGRRCDRREQR